MFKNLSAVLYVNRYLKDLWMLLLKLLIKLQLYLNVKTFCVIFPMAGVDANISFIEEFTFHNVLCFSLR